MSLVLGHFEPPYGLKLQRIRFERASVLKLPLLFHGLADIPFGEPTAFASTLPAASGTATRT